ncbi:Surface antigen protein 2 [Candida parapsilosis]|uniref:Surface antigen protein 2 n=1 Tax=Candida parapsilosis TaxID=5480 RepID=A0A8X7TAI3_CANPA|nr:Surface antigen protein 2 [Candida parapsilosis]KAF6046231.1 Surface antigen protein 2 [Candida parapsilosis]KAF6046831.1 Surface antigen protein 2 [Candida parapsilosis]KAF6051328.1 Surface antigen protein 2 [Candida parapsilosis]KAF6061948.1 Surface antigen protein 2 [Candida parapsilosis]
MKYEFIYCLIAILSIAIAADEDSITTAPTTIVDNPYATYPSVPKTASINGFADRIYDLLPECAKPCMFQNTGVTPCPYWDTGCLCIMPMFQDKIGTCIAENCRGEDVLDARSLATSVCSIAGVWDPYWMPPASVTSMLEFAATAAPISSTVESSIEETTIEESSVEESITEESTAEESTIVEPTAEESTAEESTAEESTAEESTIVEPTAEESSVVEPSVVESTVVESTVVEPTAEESTAEESTVVEPTAEESITEESTAEESTTEESTAEESTVMEPSAEPSVESSAEPSASHGTTDSVFASSVESTLPTESVTPGESFVISALFNGEVTTFESNGTHIKLYDGSEVQFRIVDGLLQVGESGYVHVGTVGELIVGDVDGATSGWGLENNRVTLTLLSATKVTFSDNEVQFYACPAEVGYDVCVADGEGCVPIGAVAGPLSAPESSTIDEASVTPSASESGDATGSSGVTETGASQSSDVSEPSVSHSSDVSHESYPSTSTVTSEITTTDEEGVASTLTTTIVVTKVSEYCAQESASSVQSEAHSAQTSAAAVQSTCIEKQQSIVTVIVSCESAISSLHSVKSSAQQVTKTEIVYSCESQISSLSSVEQQAHKTLEAVVSEYDSAVSVQKSAAEQQKSAAQVQLSEAELQHSSEAVAHAQSAAAEAYTAAVEASQAASIASAAKETVAAVARTAPGAEETGETAPQGEGAGETASQSEGAGETASQSEGAGEAAPQGEGAGEAAPQGEGAGEAAPQGEGAGEAAPQGEGAGENQITQQGEGEEYVPQDVVQTLTISSTIYVTSGGESTTISSTGEIDNPTKSVGSANSIISIDETTQSAESINAGHKLSCGVYLSLMVTTSMFVLFSI